MDLLLMADCGVADWCEGRDLFHAVVRLLRGLRGHVLGPPAHAPTQELFASARMDGVSNSIHKANGNSGCFRDALAGTPSSLSY